MKNSPSYCTKSCATLLLSFDGGLNIYPALTGGIWSKSPTNIIPIPANGISLLMWNISFNLASILYKMSALTNDISSMIINRSSDRFSLNSASFLSPEDVISLPNLKSKAPWMVVPPRKNIFLLCKKFYKLKKLTNKTSSFSGVRKKQHSWVIRLVPWFSQNIFRVHGTDFYNCTFTHT